MTARQLPSWRDGVARAALLDLLDNVDRVDPARRVAVSDNDGTLWCERPRYPQLDFLVRELRRHAADVDDVDGFPVLHRTGTVLGQANEGDAKAANIQLHVGARPILAAGNSAGDAHMLEQARGADRDGVALLVDHDDADREYAHESEALTFDATPVLDTAAARGWTVASMREDWTTVFA